MKTVIHKCCIARRHNDMFYYILHCTVIYNKKIHNPDQSLSYEDSMHASLALCISDRIFLNVHFHKYYTNITPSYTGV